MSKTLVDLSKRVDCNPRSIKRLVNLLQIISEIGKIKPAENSRDSIDKWRGGQPWTDFSPKIVAWILLAQNFPFRLSTLVQILLDFEQKKTFNERILPPSIKPTFKYHSCQQFDGEKVAAADDPEYPEWTKFDDMLIFDFYQTYVEKFIHALGRYEMLSRLDHDPEEFAYLLKESAILKVKCKHVLGLKLNKSDGTEEGKDLPRHRDFSLLAYSFNLDPAMRLEVCI